MKLFYGWVIVGAGIVITCLGMGTMMSLGIFLQPMSLATGWSRTSISMAALLNFLCMGPASFFWGALSDRFGTRAVVLSGGARRQRGFTHQQRGRDDEDPGEGPQGQHREAPAVIVDEPACEGRNRHRADCETSRDEGHR